MFTQVEAFHYLGF